MDYEACKRVRVKINPEYRDLPAGYTQVKWLKSSGTQYIKLGLNTSTDTELEADISLSVIDNQMLWANNNTVTNRISCYLSNTGNSNFGNKTLANNNLLTHFTLNTKTNVKENAEGIFINGTKRVNFNNEGTISVGDEMYIFTAKNTSASGLNGNMYDCTVKQSNTLKRDLVPAYNSKTLQAGMYDKSWDNTKCGVKVLDGTERWSDDGSTAYIRNCVADWGVKDSTKQLSICSHFVYSSNTSNLGIRFDSDFNINKYKQIDESITDLATFTQWLATQYANGTPVIIYYQRTTDTTWQPPFYTNAGTGEFILGPVVEKYITYESYQIIRPLSNNQEICFNKTIRHKSGRLPVAYQEVVYLKSDGNQYIDTGILPSQITKIKSKYSINNVSASNVQYICGARNQSGVAIGYAVYSDWHGGATIYANGWPEVGKVLANDEVVETETIISPPNVEFKINDETKYTEQVNVDRIGNNNITLFALNGGLAEYKSGSIICYNEMYNGDVLVSNLIPCYRKLDNKPGYYDLVNNELHVNQGTGEFEVGPDVN